MIEIIMVIENYLTLGLIIFLTILSVQFTDGEKFDRSLIMATAIISLLYPIFIVWALFSKDVESEND